MPGLLIPTATSDTTNINDIKVYSSAAARDAAMPSPAEGTVVYILDEDSLEYYDGTSWTAVGSGTALPVDFLLVGA